MTFFRRSILFSVLTFLSWSFSFAQVPTTPVPASMVAGAIKAANVRGVVKKVNLRTKGETDLQNGETLIHEHAVVTGAGESSAILVFANGSTVRIGNNSRLEIREFMMDPLQADVANVAALTNEPTVSRTNLRLEFGEVVGNVKTLNRAAGSTFSVSTPAGAAGIRGTTFRIVYRPTGNGQAFNFQLSTSEGVVMYEGTTQLPAAVQVPLGQEMSVVAQVDSATNTITVGAPTGTVPISGDASAALQTATVQIIQTQQQTTFTQVDMQGAQQQNRDLPAANSQSQSPLELSEGNPPPPPSAAPRLTPGG